MNYVTQSGYQVAQPERNKLGLAWSYILGSIKALYKLLLDHPKLIQFKV